MNSERSHIHNKIQFWLLLGIAFFIPIYDKVTAVLIAILLLNWLIEGRFRQKFKSIQNNKGRRNLFLFSVLYLVYVIGLIYSENLGYAFSDLETKLSILIFPLIFSTINFEWFKGKLKQFLYAFICGSFLISIILLTRSAFNYIGSNDTSAFFYGQLSWYHHASYIALFLVFSISILLIFLIEKNDTLPAALKRGFPILIFYFSVIIIFLSSKAGLISLALLLAFGAVYLIYKKKYFKGVLLLIITVLGFWLALKFLPDVSSRINNAQEAISKEQLNTETSESTSERLLIWQSCYQIIKENTLIGVGTGDIKDRLLLEYEKDNISAAYKDKLNAHNQYLQIFIALGIAGFIVLLLSLLLPIISAYNRRQLVYLLFLLLIGFNLLFESMFERQAGVVFYAFFNGLLFFYTKLNNDTK